MKKVICFVMLISIVALFCISLTGCGTTSAAWKNDEVSTIQKGTTTESVLQRFGQPYTKYSSNDLKIWEYRKPAEASSGRNTMMAIASYGMASGQDSVYVDILRIKFKDNIVVDIESEENVMGVNLPGMRSK
jgi:hypothetical protein